MAKQRQQYLKVMNKAEKRATIKRFEERFSQFGYSPKAMGWRDKKQQELRFKILVQIGGLNGSSILDVGCGFGDLYGYLRKKNLRVKYTGVDISPKLIEKAKQLYPGANFKVKDIISDSYHKRFDYIFASGMFNWRIGNNKRYTKDMVSKMFSLCRKGVAVNMMTTYVDYKDDYLYYYDPKEILDYCKSLSRFVAIRHDYPLYEFTVYILKKPAEM